MNRGGHSQGRGRGGGTGGPNTGGGQSKKLGDDEYTKGAVVEP